VHHFAAQLLLEYCGQYVRTYVQASATAAALGAQAVGIDVALPEEVIIFVDFFKR
jgi:hypothetical protein